MKTDYKLTPYSIKDKLMNVYTRNQQPQKFIILLVLFVVLLSSCKKENVCTLTPENFPEIRGFKLGTNYDDMAKRVSEMCKPYQEQDGKFEVFVRFKPTNESNCDPSKSGGKVDYYLNPEKYPDFEGISGLYLSFSDKRLTSIHITYNQTNDYKFVDFFFENSIKSLGLSDWSNWEFYKDENQGSEKNIFGSILNLTSEDRKKLLCQKVNINIFVLKKFAFSAEAPPTFSPNIIISETEETALTQSQLEDLKKQDQLTEQQKKSEEQQKRVENQNKREVFKP